MQLIIGITFDFCIPKILTFAGEKDKNMKYRKTHLINEHCDCQVVETRNADEKIRRLNESTNSTYHIDVDWYLANGYSVAEEAFRRIESQAPELHYSK